MIIINCFGRKISRLVDHQFLVMLSPLTRIMFQENNDKQKNDEKKPLPGPTPSLWKLISLMLRKRKCGKAVYPVNIFVNNQENSDQIIEMKSKGGIWNNTSSFGGKNEHS